MPDKIIDWVHYIADRQKMSIGLAFTKIGGTTYPNIEYDDLSTGECESSVELYNEPDDTPVAEAVEDPVNDGMEYNDLDHPTE